MKRRSESRRQAGFGTPLHRFCKFLMMLSEDGQLTFLTMTIANKGAVKVQGTVNGVKVSAKSQLLVGETACCFPVVVTKKVTLSFTVWIDLETQEISVTGLGDAAEIDVGKLGNLASEARLEMETEALLEAVPEAEEFADYLPNGASVAQSGTKWIVAGGAKAGKVVLGKDGNVVVEKLGDNPSGLKLTYKAKEGSFKGSFKVYALVNGKVKNYSVSVEGVLINGRGYGRAVLKKPAADFLVTIE